MSVALVIRDAKHISHIILPSVAFPAVLYFFTLSHKGIIFGKKIIESNMCVWFSQQRLSETFLNLRITQREITINYKVFM